MGKTGSIQVKERLSGSRLALRAAGAIVTFALCAGFGYVMLGVIRASGNAPLPGWGRGWLASLAAHPPLAVSLAVGLTCAASLLVIAATWLPTRRRFSVDRANLYVITGRQSVRHGIGDVTVASGPYRLEVDGRAYLISHRDWERLTSFRRGLANEVNRRIVRSAAITSAKVVRHPTQPAMMGLTGR